MRRYLLRAPHPFPRSEDPRAEVDHVSILFAPTRTLEIVRDICRLDRDHCRVHAYARNDAGHIRYFTYALPRPCVRSGFARPMDFFVVVLNAFIRTLGVTQYRSGLSRSF